MKVTRDVIYDLLPMYFAGDTSEDTRSLIEEFFAGDPEFGRMAERFRTLITEHPSAAQIETERAKIVFDRAKARAKLRLATVIWAMGALFSFGMAALTGPKGLGLLHPGVIIGAVFTVSALSTWLMCFSPQPEWWYAAFTGDETN